MHESVFSKVGSRVLGKSVFASSHLSGGRLEDHFFDCRFPVRLDIESSNTEEHSKMEYTHCPLALPSKFNSEEGPSLTHATKPSLFFFLIGLVALSGSESQSSEVSHTGISSSGAGNSESKDAFSLSTRKGFLQTSKLLEGIVISFCSEIVLSWERYFFSFSEDPRFGKSP